MLESDIDTEIGNSVSALRGEDISETAVRADTMMMEEKRKYYQINGIDRRRVSR